MRLRSAVLVGAMALALLAPVAAHALVRADSHLDQIGDVAYFLYEDGPGGHFPTVDSTRTNGDVRGLHAVHGATTVHVAMYFRSLPRAGIKNTYEFIFKGPEFVNFRTLRIIAKPGNWKGYPVFTNFSGKRPSCPGLKYLIEYSHKRVVVDVPRSCLSRPAYVRIGAQSLYSVNDRLWVDDAQFDGDGYSGVGYGPALHHP